MAPLTSRRKGGGLEARAAATAEGSMGMPSGSGASQELSPVACPRTATTARRRQDDGEMTGDDEDPAGIDENRRADGYRSADGDDEKTGTTETKISGRVE